METSFYKRLTYGKRWSKLFLPCVVAPVIACHVNWDVVATVAVMNSCNL